MELNPSQSPITHTSAQRSCCPFGVSTSAHAVIKQFLLINVALLKGKCFKHFLITKKGQIINLVMSFLRKLRLDVKCDFITPAREQKQNEVDKGRYRGASHFINRCILLNPICLHITSGFTQLLTHTQLNDFIVCVCLWGGYEDLWNTKCIALRQNHIKQHVWKDSFLFSY